jgi:hypothetical protein
MKAILYVSALLMVGASVYGFVDYRKSSTENLYDESKKEKGKSPETKVVPVVTPAVEVKKETPKKATVAKRAVVKKKKKISTKMYSRGRIVEDLPKPVVEKESVKSN